MSKEVNESIKTAIKCKQVKILNYIYDFWYDDYTAEIWNLAIKSLDCEIIQIIKDNIYFEDRCMFPKTWEYIIGNYDGKIVGLLDLKLYKNP